MNPKVSVIMSVRNGEQFLPKTLESVLSQSFIDFEFLIADDMSTDGTASILCKYAGKDKRIKLAVNYQNIGLTKSLNKLIDEASGHFIARIDADDLAKGDRLERQVLMLSSDDKMVMSTSCYQAINENGMQLYSHCPSCSPFLLKWSLIFRNNIRHSTVMWKKDINLKYNEEYKYSQDYDMWCRMARLGSIGVVPDPLSEIRCHDAAITSDKRKEQDDAAADISSSQFAYYTGENISRKESEGLRLMCYLKDELQFKQTEEMSEEEIKNSVFLYLKVLKSFCKIENVAQEDMLNEVKNDINSLTNSTKTRKPTLEAFEEWSSAHDGLEKIAATFRQND